MGEPRFLLLAVTGPVAGVTGIGWRLLGPNNRELGRGPAPVAGLEACRADIDRLVAAAPDAEGVLSRGGGGLGWGWTLQHDGVPLARSGRLFHRERECRYSLDHFLLAVPVAAVRWPGSPAGLPVVSARAFAGSSSDALLNEDVGA